MSKTVIGSLGASHCRDAVRLFRSAADLLQLAFHGSVEEYLNAPVMPHNSYDRARRDILDLAYHNSHLPDLTPEHRDAIARFDDESGNPGPSLDPVLHLSLDGRQLETLPPEIGDVEGLQYLSLRDNNLTKLPSEIGRLEHLMQLDLRGNRFNEFPAEVLRLKSLKRINLSGNQLSTLPGEIAQLAGLQELSLQENQLTGLPPEIAQLKALTGLDLRQNRITSLSPSIADLSRLVDLDLGKNRLAALPPEIGRLASLQCLILSENRLASLPPSIGQLTALLTLDLRENRLEALPHEIARLSSLRGAALRSSTRGLLLDRNPLPQPYPALVREGQPSATINVLAWLSGEFDPASSPPKIPPQEYGAHFEIRDDGVVISVPPEALDRHGNNVARLRELHPVLRALCSNLVDALDAGNVPHAHLLDRAKAYRELVDRDLNQINFSLLYAEGVRLANASQATFGDELPALGVEPREAIDSLLHLHGTFILATAKGIELITAEERYRRTSHEEIHYRKAALELAMLLRNAPKIVDPKVASFIVALAEEIGRGVSPERSGAVATGAIRNIAIVVSTAATLAAFTAAALATGSTAVIAGAGATVLLVGEGLKKSRAFTTLSALVAKNFDKTSEAELGNALSNLTERLKPHLRFVLSAEHQLRRLAGQREEFAWLDRLLTWITRQSANNPLKAAGVHEFSQPDEHWNFDDGLSGPRGVADDLKNLSGSSPAIERALNDLGIFHFFQIAELGSEDARRIGEKLGLPSRIDDWIAESKKYLLD